METSLLTLKEPSGAKVPNEGGRGTTPDRSSGEAVVERLFAFNGEVGLPTRLREIGVREEHIETLADLAIADFAHPNNPKPVSREDFKKLYLEAI